MTDATSGPAASSASGLANTDTAGTHTAPVNGSDRRGKHDDEAVRLQRRRAALPRPDSPTRVGTAGNDVINGTPGRDIIVAIGGNDTINGNDGNDVICGGDGADTINGGNGADVVDGGAGPDSIFGSDGNDTLDGGAQNDSIRGDGGNDTCTSGEVRMSSCETIT